MTTRIRGGEARGVERVTMRQVRERFADMMDRSGSGERFIVTRHGKPRAALVSIEDYEILRRYWPDERTV